MTINYTPRRLRGGVGVLRPPTPRGEAKTRGGGPTPATVNTPSFPRKRESIQARRKSKARMDSRFRGNDGDEGAFHPFHALHPPGAVPADFVVGDCSDPPPQAAGGKKFGNTRARVPPPRPPHQRWGGG